MQERQETQGSVPGCGRAPGGEHGNPLQYSWLDNLMDKGAWWATIYGGQKSQTPLKQFSKHIYIYIYMLAKLIRSDQISRSVMSNSLRPHELQHARPPCPSPTPRVLWDSRPSSQWCLILPPVNNQDRKTPEEQLKIFFSIICLHDQMKFPLVYPIIIST